MKVGVYLFLIWGSYVRLYHSYFCGMADLGDMSSTRELDIEGADTYISNGGRISWEKKLAFKLSGTAVNGSVL